MRPKVPSPTWRSFLRNHMRNMAAVDMFVVATATFRLLYALIVLGHDRRRIIHFEVTQNPTQVWLARQMTEAFPWDTAPRLPWVWLYWIWPQVIDAMVLVKPATVVQWHRKGFRLYWRWRSRRPGRPKIGTEIRDLIRRMSKANPLWGAPRIHGELLKLGIKISQASWAVDAVASQGPVLAQK